jgi:hypothetical protein
LQKILLGAIRQFGGWFTTLLSLNIFKATELAMF